MARFFPLSLVLFLSATLLSGVLAGLVQHDDNFQPDAVLHITVANISVACAHRETVVVNGSTPGPLLKLKEGKTSWIRVYNDMSDQNMTMHWHGLSQRTAPFSDGTPLASQWPIPAKHFFDYEVRPEVGDAGTYFYHSHVGFQAATCSGPIIVEEAAGCKPPYEYDDEKVVLISEFYNKTDKVIVDGLAKIPMVWPGEPSALLVNGNSPPVAASTDNGSCSPEVISVEPDTKYRFRFIGGTALTLITLGIEEHDNFTIIEVDGAYTKPYAIDHIQVGSGQRFDVLFKTKSQAELSKSNKTSFYVQLETRDRATQTSSYAVLVYGGANPITKAPASPPVSLPEHAYAWKAEYSLEPLKRQNFPTAAEVTRRVVLNHEQVLAQSRWQVNGHMWSETINSPAKPWLVNIFENGDAAIPSYSNAITNGGYDPATNAFPAKVGEVIEIIFFGKPAANGTGYDSHPWHAHGGHVYDIGAGEGPYNETANEERLKNFTPVMRDTTMLYKYTSAGGWRGWRIRVEDAGVWMIHCHTIQHMLMGLQTVWVMGDAKQVTREEPEDMTGYLTYGGSVYGNDTYAPLVHHHFGNNGSTMSA